MRTFKARLTGGQEVPRVQTVASGDAVFRLSQDGSRLFFRLVVRNIARVTQAHIHLGRKGQNGPVVAFLFGPSKFGISVRRGVVRGSLTSNDLVGPLAGMRLSDLINEMRNCNTYANVHTIQNPNGEIRGQILK
ncbi:CHRD domain-containing protein [Cohnella suwonensis]|uniref:CHRD domain-containing protein n=1 Tax=Cohnella suwonensis TaxID=696072 RepID=A0ABW0LSH0_9BACL